MTEQEEKEAFAKAWLKNPDPFAAALSLYPDDTNHALRIAVNWPKDPIVLAAKEVELKDDGELKYLPTKADLARQVWTRCQGADDEEFTKMAKLYAEIMDYIPKVNKVALTDPSGKHSAQPIQIIATPLDEAL